MGKKHEGPGRPKKRRPAPARVTRCVRRLIDLAHDGNIRQASEEIGIPYATLRDLYSGRRSNPGINTVAVLAEHYGVPLAWFTDERQPDELPVTGLISTVDPPPWLVDGNPREIKIPWTAWEFIKVRRALHAYLAALPPAYDRPIIGGESERVANQKLDSFLLRPVLDAEWLGEPSALILSNFRGEVEEKWSRRLRELGRMWEGVLAEILAKGRQAMRDGEAK